MWRSRSIVRLLKNRELKISFAESCTGGLLAAQITAVPGSSEIFDLGVVTYANSAKINLLGVSQETLSVHGAVSEKTAEEMMRGLKKISQADIAISVTGIAGPSGGTHEKPVGLVYVGYMFPTMSYIERNIFQGSRKNIRNATVQHILQKINRFLEEQG